MGPVAIMRSWMAVILVLLLKELGTRCHGCWEHERTALLHIKASFPRPSLYSYSPMPRWGIDADCCNWDGIWCNETTNRVTQLDLWDAVDGGYGGWYLNASLFLPFKDLTSLDLLGNQIHGCIENEGFEKLSELVHLDSLALDDNEFNNSILSSLCGLSSLKSLDLCGNKLKGIVDIQELHALNQLEKLNLSANEIIGFVTAGGNNLNSSILSSFKRLSSLKVLNLGYNLLKGSIDMKELHALSQLEELNLERNEIIGFVAAGGNNLNSSILSSFKRLSSLKVLNLGFNLLKGSIDMKELHALSQLEELDLEGNEIIGFVAAGVNKSWSNCSVLSLGGTKRNASLVLKLQSLHDFFPNLRILYLESSNLQRILFGSYNLNNLEQLYLDNSIMDDNFLQSIGALVSLQNLSIQSSNLSQITQGWPCLKSLKALNLNSATLSHSMIQTIGNLVSLEYLLMSDCQLSGPVPIAKGLCRLNKLQYLHMDGNYLNSTMPPCLCKLNQLEVLSFSYCNLSGTLPPCLANLTALRQLDLSDNQLTGNVSLSPLRTLTSLENLDLSNNQFQIPVTLSPFFNLTKLDSFYAFGNNILAEIEQHHLIPKFQLIALSLSGFGCGGTFPKFLYYQHNLHVVDLSHIQLSGGFPYWLVENNTGLYYLYLVNNSLSGQLRWPSHSNGSLKYLDISENCFRGHVPALIGAQLLNLQRLNLSGNGLNGRIPPSLGNMSSLKSLDLSNNRLSGDVPGQLATGCFMLAQLKLSNNSLEGPIPNRFFNSSSLVVLDLSHNNINGKLPQWIGNMYALQVMDLSDNDIAGSLPSNFPLGIQQVYLSKNRLQGPLQNAFHNSNNLVMLDLGRNNFTGRIPEWISTLSNLSYLLLDNNDFEGEIPNQLCKLGKISLIDFSHNYLSSHILPCLRVGSTWTSTHSTEMSSTYIGIWIVGLRKLFQLHAEITTKRNSYSYKGRLLSYMSGIDLSCNILTGEIPQELGKLSTIKELNLSHNCLKGPIPSTFSNLEAIESLDLSYNNLNGKIPPQLIQLYQLEVFIVAHNNLSGKTPEMVAQFATFDNSSYKDNPLLCGPPLTKSCNAHPSPPSLSENSCKHKEETGFINMDAFYPSFLASYSAVLLGMAAVLYINPHWRRAWLYLVGECINSCYYFIVDNLSMSSKYRAWTPCV